MPVNYDYTKLLVEDFSSKSYQTKSENEKQKGDEKDSAAKNVRYFWDGGMIANTPLREAVIDQNDYEKSKVYLHHS